MRSVTTGLSLLVAAVCISSSLDRAMSQSKVPIPTEYAVPGERTFPESIAFDEDTGTFYTGSADRGIVYRGSRNATEMIPHISGAAAPPASNGLRLLPSGELLVAGGRSGSLFVYAADGSLVRGYNSTPSEQTFVNDAVVTSADEAFVTDSIRPVLFRTDPSRRGSLEPWLDLTRTPIKYGEGFNLNGIVATEDNRFLVVAQTNARRFWRIDRRSKEVRMIDTPNGEGGADGMRLRGNRLFAVRDGGVSVYELSVDALKAVLVSRVDDPRFNGPTAIAIDGDDLLVVNAQFAAREGVPNLPFTITRVAGAAAVKRGDSL